MIFECKIGKQHFLFQLRVHLLNEKVWTTGITNSCDDSRFVFFADYDNTPYHFVEGDVQYLQKKYGLSDAYIIQSDEKSFHAIIPDKMPLKELLTIMSDCACDPAYSWAARRVDHCWILRTEVKGNRPAPEFYRVIKSPYHAREKSLKHLKFLALKHGVKPDYRGADDSTEVELRNYETLSHTSKTEKPSEVAVRG
jgi:hypothetical protein